MSRTIHINLLKKSERRSSLPVRFRVMIPLLSCLLVLIILLGTGMLGMKRKTVQTGLQDIASKREDLKSPHAEYLLLKARERAARVELGQLESYSGGRLIYSPALVGLPHVVPLTMQLSSLQVTPPGRIFESLSPKKGEKATEKDKKMTERESVSLQLSGLVDSAASIDALKAKLLSEVFTNLVVDVEVPRGAFKASGSARGQYLFELNAAFTERVFK